jgi:hypothetical protein
MLDENTNTVNKNKEAVMQESNENGVEVNAEKIKHVIGSGHQTAGENYNLLITNTRKSFGSSNIWERQ